MGAPALYQLAAVANVESGDGLSGTGAGVIGYVQITRRVDRSINREFPGRNRWGVKWSKCTGGRIDAVLAYGLRVAVHAVEIFTGGINKWIARGNSHWSHSL